MPARKRKPRAQAPLPTFSLTVQSVAPMPVVREKLDIYRKVNLKLTPEMARQLILELQKQIEAGIYPTVTVDGIVAQ